MIPLLAAALAAVLMLAVTIRTLPPAGRRGKWVGMAGAVLLFGSPLNVAALLSTLGRSGGSPDGMSGGRYYVSSHGQRTEVTEGEWHRLRNYERVTLVVTPIGIAAGIGLLGGYLRAAVDRRTLE